MGAARGQFKSDLLPDPKDANRRFLESPILLAREFRVVGTPNLNPVIAVAARFAFAMGARLSEQFGIETSDKRDRKRGKQQNQKQEFDPAPD
jgi:hypothetical protein